jgi:riboflavin synthase alpha subunit
MKNYIEQKKQDWAMNIKDFKLGQLISDSGCVSKITNMTQNSIEVLVVKKTKKGIDCKGWFDMKAFNKRFTTIK